MAKTLLIGCGGTGIKALVSFNKQMAGDPERRHRMAEEVSYLVIDTNRDDINAFERGINAGMESAYGGNIRPIVKTVHITETNSLLNDITHKYIVRQKNEQVLSEIRKHWWFSPDGVPYTAIYRRDTGDGAAQCPPISYMFMWEYLPRLEKVIDSLLNEIVARNNEERNPLEGLQVYLVAGLSGGTGRGTWNLVAFKVRECILRRVPSARVDLPAIFLDSSCYAALTPNAPDKNIPKQVNSVTGLSELSAWLAIRDIRNCYNYSLPVLSSTSGAGMHSALSRMTDVIHVESKTEDPYFQSPVRYAYLVFADNGRQKLHVGNGRNEYCNMVGVALYALVAHSFQFKGDMCNGLLKYCSFGAVSAEVETVDLQKFFNSDLRRTKVLALCEAVSDEESDAYGMQLMEDFKLRQDAIVDEDYMNGLSPEATDAKDIVEIVRASLRNVKPILNSANVQENVFLEQKYASVKSKLQAYLTSAKIRPEVVTKALDDLMTSWANSLEAKYAGEGNEGMSELSSAEKSLSAKPLSRYLWQLVLGAYRYNGEPSVARALLCVNRLIKKINDATDRLPEIDDGAQSLFKNCLDWSKNQAFWSDPYDAVEKKKLIGGLLRVYENDIYLSLRAPLLKFLDEASRMLNRWKGMLMVIVNALESVAYSFELAANKDCTGSEAESAYNRLFVNTDIQSIRASIPVGTITARTIRRVFKPIMSRENIRALLSERELSYVGSGKIEAFIKEKFCRLLALKADKPTDDDCEVLKSELTSLFQSNVSVNTVRLGAKLTLEEVLRRNIVHWNRALDDAHNRGIDAERELQDRFRTYLGLRDDRNGIDGYDYVPSTTGAPHMLLEREQNIDGSGAEGVKNRLPVSLMVNCEPWILFDLEDERLGVENLQKTVLLPYKLSLGARENIKSEIVRHDTRRGGQVLDVLDSSEDAGRFNPADRIVAFSSVYVPLDCENGAAFDHIVSLQHDIADPQVLQRLMLAESPEGEGYLGYFVKNNNPMKKAGDREFEERPIGLGFVSPVFVAEPELVSRRWKPWKTAIDEAEDKARSSNQVYEVLAYAFTGSGVAAGSAMKKEIADEGWAFPMLGRSSKAKTKKSGKFVFLRQALGVPDDEVCEWNAGDGLPGIGITQVVNWLMGKGIPDANGVVNEQVAAEGSAVFKRMVAEKKFFEENIRGKFKPAFWGSVVKERVKWIASEVSTKTKILDCDRETWKKILAAAASE